MGSTWIVLGAIEFAVLIAVTWCLLRHYAAKTVSCLAWTTVFISWFVPADVADAF